MLRPEWPAGEQPVLEALHRIADVMAQHYAAGRRHLLTEDVLRFATVALLEDNRVTPNRLAIEVAVPGAARGKLDLVVDQDIAIEFKFPGDPISNVSAADTMIFGEILSDLYRLGTLPYRQRLAVWLLHDRFVGYLTRAAERYAIDWPTGTGQWLRLPAGLRHRLPATAATILADAGETAVEAQVLVHRPAGDGVWLRSWERDQMVAPLGPGSGWLAKVNVREFGPHVAAAGG